MGGENNQTNKQTDRQIRMLGRVPSLLMILDEGGGGAEGAGGLDGGIVKKASAYSRFGFLKKKKLKTCSPKATRFVLDLF